jgi:NAD(P)-dependent dehydrogenase (short-subunit alcohol dehydrogenase family)
VTNDLQGNVALITGSAGGIGLGIAQAFAEEGVKLALADIDEAALAEAAAGLRESGAEVIALPLDVTDRTQWEAAVTVVESFLGPVQLLFNNAGVSTLGMGIEDVTTRIWDQVVAINLTGVYNGIHFVLEGMRAAGGGHIVNTASMGGLAGFPKLSPYSATKAAVIALSEALDVELAPEGIRVSVLAPGGVRSRLWRTSRKVRGLPDTEVPPDDGSAQSAGPGGMDPYEVGRRVVAGVRNDDRYIFTHPEARPLLVQRFDRMLHDLDAADAFVV